jgi:hypothetical protein
MSERFLQFENYFISVRHIIWIGPNPGVPGGVKVVLSNGETLTAIGGLEEVKRGLNQL